MIKIWIKGQGQLFRDSFFGKSVEPLQYRVKESGKSLHETQQEVDSYFRPLRPLTALCTLCHQVTFKNQSQMGKRLCEIAFDQPFTIMAHPYMFINNSQFQKWLSFEELTHILSTCNQMWWPLKCIRYTQKTYCEVRNLWSVWHFNTSKRRCTANIYRGLQGD